MNKLGWFKSVLTGFVCEFRKKSGIIQLVYGFTALPNCNHKYYRYIIIKKLFWSKLPKFKNIHSKISTTKLTSYRFWQYTSNLIQNFFNHSLVFRPKLINKTRSQLILKFFQHTMTFLLPPVPTEASSNSCL